MPPVLEKGFYSSNATNTLNSVITYRCERNYVFQSTGRNVATSTCVLADGDFVPHWTSVEYCTRKSDAMLFFVYADVLIE